MNISSTDKFVKINVKSMHVQPRIRSMNISSTDKFVKINVKSMQHGGSSSSGTVTAVAGLAAKDAGRIGLGHQTAAGWAVSKPPGAPLIEPLIDAES